MRISRLLKQSSSQTSPLAKRKTSPRLPQPSRCFQFLNFSSYPIAFTSRKRRLTVKIQSRQAFLRLSLGISAEGERIVTPPALAKTICVTPIKAIISPQNLLPRGTNTDCYAAMHHYELVHRGLIQSCQSQTQQSMYATAFGGEMYGLGAPVDQRQI